MSRLWSQMGRQRRRSMATLKRADVPTSAGVYALYFDGEPMYVGKAKELLGRVWENHSGRGLSMGGSAMRRNVAEHLDIATANDIKKKRHKVTPEEAERVRAFLDRCDIAWRECTDEAAAVKLEKAMKREYLPPLTKM